MESFCPPPLSKLYEAYEKADPHKHLRFGQWIYNRYVAGTTLKTDKPYNLDLLYNTTDFETIYNIISKMYTDYQWPLTP